MAYNYLHFVLPFSFILSYYTTTVQSSMFQGIYIIIIIISTKIFIVLSSWQSHCESSLGSRNEYSNGATIGTTVFHGKFFQILRASLPNSVADCGKFSTYSN